MVIKAPFTKEQVEALNKYQKSGPSHPYTCNREPKECEVQGEDRDYTKDGVLIATEAGWVCPCGKYKQDWCHDYNAVKPVESKLDSLKDILHAIITKDIDYGENKEYCFITDEDGELVLLKRNDATSQHQKDLDESEEIRDHWPENRYDGDIIWKVRTGNNRGLDITEMFFKALNIKIAG